MKAAFLLAACGVLLCSAQVSKLAGRNSPTTDAASGVTLAGLPLEQYTVYVSSASTAQTLTIETTAANPSTFCLGAEVTAATANLNTNAACTCAANINSARYAGTTLTEQADGTITWASLEFENGPRPLCQTSGGNQLFTGFFIKSVFDCNDADTAKTCSTRGFTTLGATLQDNFDKLTPEQQAQYKARFSGANARCSKPVTSTGSSVIGTCYNARVQSACAGIVYNKQSAKCCSDKTIAETPVFRGLGSADSDRCPCTGRFSKPNPESGKLTPIGDGNAFIATKDECPSSASACCLSSKYPELSEATFTGYCFDDATERCCDTGAVYNPGEMQCCVVNGVQSLDIPCPCGADADCYGASVTTCNYASTTDTLACNADQRNMNMKCCQQTSPAPEDNVFCSKYQNYPGLAQLSNVGAQDFGTGQARVQRCPGTCIDSRFQICCNGATCVQEYEKCCNSTCCNKFVGSCQVGRRSNSPFNTEATYEQCTVVEQMSPIKAFRIFLLPAFLLLATLLSLALVLAFATKSTTRSFTLLEKCIVAVSVVALLLALPLFFSPSFKYGIAAVVAALVGIMCGAAYSKQFNLFTVVIVALAMLYFIDPFHGSQAFSFGSLRQSSGRPERMGAGMIHMSLQNYVPEVMFSAKMEQEVFDTDVFCTEFYDYFRLDKQLLDNRFDNPQVTTFGYCSRGWTITITLFGAILLGTLVFLFLLTLLGLISRFTKQPIELEVVQH